MCILYEIQFVSEWIYQVLGWEEKKNVNIVNSARRPNVLCYFLLKEGVWDIDDDGDGGSFRSYT